MIVGHLASIYCLYFLCPFNPAFIIGVHLSSFFASTCAPFISKTITTPKWPSAAAMCRAVLPSLSPLLIIPFPSGSWHKSVIATTFPLRAALCNEVRSSLSTASMSEPHLRRDVIVSREPVDAARRSGVKLSASLAFLLAPLKLKI